MSLEDCLKSCPVCFSSEAVYERTINHVDLIKCLTCGFVYVNLENEQISAENSSCGDDFLFNQIARQNVIDEVWFELVAQRIRKIMNRGRILDIGCGNGVLLKHFVMPEWDVYGVDFSPWAREFAQKYDYKLIECELENAGFPDEHFDVITSTSTLEHIPQPVQHVKEIVRLLKPHGMAYFSGIPNYGSLSVKLNLCNFYHNLPPRHVNYFSYDTLRRLFSRPEIMTGTRDFCIRTYGIPEMHRIYGLIRKCFRIIRTKLSKHPRKVFIKKNDSQESGKGILSKRQTWIKILMGLYYSSGRLFHLGDKLEVFLRK